VKVLDVRGVACPEPIVRAKKALVDDRTPQVLLQVDSAVTRDNLAKFASSKGFSFVAATTGDEWEITITRGEETGAPEPAAIVAGQAAAPVVLCKTRHFGAESGELGTILIRAFFKTLLDVDRRPAQVIFVNEGVYLACKDEAIVEYCTQLEAAGCEIMSCGTCLDYFELLDALRVGRVGNMYDIATALLEAGHVVEP
jgi:selenium metabolism protein YedF